MEVKKLIVTNSPILQMVERLQPLGETKVMVLMTPGTGCTWVNDEYWWGISPKTPYQMKQIRVRARRAELKSSGWKQVHRKGSMKFDLSRLITPF